MIQERKEKKQFYPVEDNIFDSMPEQTYENPPLTKEESDNEYCFLNAFLDLVGFSIIFPLFLSCETLSSPRRGQLSKFNFNSVQAGRLPEV